jgi:hypothetical protein
MKKRKEKKRTTKKEDATIQYMIEKRKANEHRTMNKNVSDDIMSSADANSRVIIICDTMSFTK